MQQLSNFGTTTLAITMVTTDTAGILTDGSVLPGSGNFVLLIESEYILVTAISGGNITMTRGYGGTTAVTHTSGTVVKLVLSKEVLENYFGERIQTGGYASRPATARAGWVYYATDINLAWQYDGGNWNLFHPVYVNYSKRVDLSGWTGANIGGSTWTDYNGVLVLTAISNSGDQHRFYHKAIPTAPYKINAIVQSGSIVTQFTGCGLALYDTVSGKLGTIANITNNTGTYVGVDKWTNATSFNSNLSSRQHWNNPLWFQIEDDNTNWYWRVSFNGYKYLTVYQETRNTFLTPNKIALTVNRTHTAYSSDEYYQVLSYWEE